MTEMQKKTGYIIYLDLLGYRSLIKNGDGEEIEELKDFIASLNSDSVRKTVSDTYGKEFKEDRMVFRAYSDNFLVFYEWNSPDALSLAVCIYLASQFLSQSISKGYLLRGSIVHGELQYNDEVIFGTSIINAYELESGHLEPSIVLSRDLKKIYEEFKLYEVEVISPFSAYNQDDYAGAREHFEGLEKLIHRLNGLSIVDERTLAKYRWLINEFNRYYNGYANIEFFESPSHYEIKYSDTSSNV